MSAKAELPKAYMELVQIWKNIDYAPVPADYQQLIKSSAAFATVLNQSPCVTWILDLRTQRFDFISCNTNSLLGYDTSRFTEEGLDFCNEIIHPDDLARTWKLNKTIWDLISSVEPENRGQYKFNYDYRIIKANGKQARILEQNSVLQQDRNGNITHVLGVCTDISHWKRNDHQLASVISTLDNSCLFLSSDEEGNCSPRAILSKRELEIVKLMAEGYSSKYIADKLFISFHTVNTHRQKIIEKTHTRNTTELVQFAICNGLI